MNEYIFSGVLITLSIFLIGLFLVGNRKNLKHIKAFNRSIILTAVYNILLFIVIVNINDFFTETIRQMVPIITLFLFRYVLLDYYKSVDKKINQAVKSVLVHAIPLVFLFVFSVDMLRGLVNENIDYGRIDPFHVLVILIIVLYQVFVFFDIFIQNFRSFRHSLPRYRQFYMAHILVNSVYIITTLLIYLSDRIVEDLPVSGVMYTLYLAFMCVNYIRPEWLPHAKTEKLILEDTRVRKERSGKVKNRRALDGLTGVFTREYFIKYVRELDTNDDALAIITMKITGLKLINESFGYDAGDEILQEVSMTLCDAFQNATIARMSGSFFTILTSKQTEHEISEKIRKIKANSENRDDFKVNLYFGYYMRRTQDLTPYDVFLRSKEELYYNTLVVNQKHQNKIAQMLSGNFAKLMPHLQSHLSRCADLCMEFGRFLDLSEEQLSDLNHAALLHDIALTFRPDILDYNVAFKNEFDQRVYRSHVSKGYDIALESGINAKTADAILHHHEKFNGSGYPHGLKGNEIPFYAQVISIVDFIDMYMNIGRKSKNLEKVLKEKIGIEFSSEMVYNMIAFLKEQEIIEV